MDAITHIDIRDTAFLKHHFRAGCAPIVIGMAGAIFGTAVGFGFNDDTAGQGAVNGREKLFPHELARNGDDIIPKIKSAGKNLILHGGVVF